MGETLTDMVAAVTIREPVLRTVVPDQRTVNAYLGRYRPGSSRTSERQRLRRLALAATGGATVSPAAVPWWQLDDDSELRVLRATVTLSTVTREGQPPARKTVKLWARTLRAVQRTAADHFLVADNARRTWLLAEGALLVARDRPRHPVDGDLVDEVHALHRQELTEEEVRALIGALRAPRDPSRRWDQVRDLACFALVAQGGLSAEELHGLRPDQIGSREEGITVRPGRTVCLPDDAWEAVDRAVARWNMQHPKGADAPLIGTQRPASWYTRLHSWAGRAGIPPFHTNELRRWALGRLLHAGVEENTVLDAFGIAGFRPVPADDRRHRAKVLELP